MRSLYKPTKPWYNTQAGVYRISTPCGEYFGETNNLHRRREAHWKKLRSNRHHCLLLRRVCCEYGIDSFTFEVIVAGPEWDDVGKRRALEQHLVQTSEHTLNTKLNEKIFVTQWKVPRLRYINRIVYLQVDRGIVKVRTGGKDGEILGFERIRGKVRSGLYRVDERGFLTKC